MALLLEQQFCGLCKLKKPDPDSTPRSPHWQYTTKASGQLKIAEGSCVHCRFVVYKQMKSSFSVLRRPENAVDFHKAVRASRTRRFVTEAASKTKPREEAPQFVQRSTSKVRRTFVWFCFCFVL